MKHLTAAMTEPVNLNAKGKKKRNSVALFIDLAIKAFLFLFIFFMTTKKRALKAFKKMMDKDSQ